MGRYWLKDHGGAKLVRKAVILSGMILGSPYQAQWLRQEMPAHRPPPVPAAAVPDDESDTRVPRAGHGRRRDHRSERPRQALPGITYYNITTLREEESAPFWINLMTGPGRYRNIVTQDLCPNDPIVHTTLNIAPSTQSLIDGLLRTGAARMTCMTPSSPAMKVKPLRTPPGVRLPAGSVMPPQFVKYYR
ncbi:hypothetical protein GOARA_056_01100 [Gordonia araii NBRC 100433]|uniref:Triacylglycerol lipase n=1 Tax=Gordonia araii NBRC 100433 TaxID=1073574 RepID=G7H3D7_9ACTN|nr:hypothetical protein GOARA_056_01100 [Gordonia araii NBRC 100433]